jgi:hypothetical protein
MSAAPSAHATILDFFMTMLLLRAGVHFDYVAAPHRPQHDIPHARRYLSKIAHSGPTTATATS